jgi:hypothetical protein
MMRILRPAVIIASSWLFFAVVFVPPALRYGNELAERARKQQSVDTPDNEEHEKYENPEARLELERLMLQNPRTKRIPDNIRRKELAFTSHLPSREQAEAKNGKQVLGNPLQSSTAKSSSFVNTASGIQAEAWSSVGPFNVGGRTRAFAVDASNESVYLAAGVSGGIWRTENAGRTWQRVLGMDNLPNISCFAQDTRPGKTNIWYAGTGEGWGNSASADGAPFRGDGIYKSTDGGRTWRLLPSTSTNTPQRYDQRFDYAWAIAANPANLNQDEVLVATFGCLKRSTDGGATWQTVLGTDSVAISGRFMDLAIAPRSGVMYATLSRAAGESGTATLPDIPRGIFRSTDGVTWTAITPTTFPRIFRRIVIAVDPLDESTVYFLAETPENGFKSMSDDDAEWHTFLRYHYRSGNGTGAGGVWEDLSANLPAFTADGVQGDYASQYSYNMVLRVKPDDSRAVFLGGTNLYRSMNAFATGSQTSWIGGYASNRSFALRRDHHCDQHSMAFLRTAPNAMISANDGGVFITDNVMLSQPSWRSLNNGYITTQFYTVAIDARAGNSPVIIGGLQDNGTLMTTSSSPTAAWQRVYGGDGSSCALGATLSTGARYVYVSSQYGNIVRYTYNASLTAVTGSGALIKPMGASDFAFITPFVLDPSNPNTLYTTAGRDLWRQSNLAAIPNGTNAETSQGWTRWQNAVASGERITAFGVETLTPTSSAAATGTDKPTRLYIGTSRGRVLRLDNAQSASGTTAPINITSPLFPSGGYVSCIAVDPLNASRAIVVFSNYEVQSLFFTDNAGVTWTAIGGTLEERPDGTGSGPSCRCATILNAGGRLRVFVGTSTGLYSADRLDGNATRWVKEGASVIGSAIVQALASRSTDGRVVAATHGNGVFAANVDVAAPLLEGDDVVVLAQNTPNPFIDATTVRYKLTAPTVVNVSIYDMAGRPVATLVQETQNAGTYQVVWDGKAFDGVDVPSGFYVCRLSAGTSGRALVRTAQLHRVR